MKTERFELGGIPALLWGEPSDRVIVAVHGSQSHKADAPIALLAHRAAERGRQVLSFDLPGHGDRKGGDPCKAQNGVADLTAVMAYARGRWGRVGLFGNSLGASFSLLACRDEPPEEAWFLSPVVDMERLIETMMAWSGVTPERLEREQVIPTPMGETLYWDYYRYVREHPVCRWEAPTHILYGAGDTLCERERVEDFARRYGCALEIVPDGEHFFHTGPQLAALSAWLSATV